MTATPANATALLSDFAPTDPAAPPRCFVLVPCAGAGSRAGTAQPKQYQPVAGQPMVMHTLAALAAVRRQHAGAKCFQRIKGFAGARRASYRLGAGA